MSWFDRMRPSYPDLRTRFMVNYPIDQSSSDDAITDAVARGQRLSPARKEAIERHIAEGRARSIAHCEFLARAGTLELPA